MKMKYKNIEIRKAFNGYFVYLPEERMSIGQCVETSCEYCYYMHHNQNNAERYYSSGVLLDIAHFLNQLSKEKPCEK